DAIEISRHLRIEYLWIDSLCIIQDDEMYMQKESALMTEVYGSSSINIAATGAIGGSKGCFEVRDQTALVYRPIQIVDGANTSYFALIKRSLFFQCTSHTPLGTRAWCLQERMLASRITNLGTLQLFWECRENETPESFSTRFRSQVTFPKQMLRNWKEPKSLDD
ncbi:hypothetical protein B0J14DRAFT_493696, partial [Halenospora varia]